MKSFFKMLWAIVVGFFLKSCDSPQNEQIGQTQEQHPTTVDTAEATETPNHKSDEQLKAVLKEQAEKAHARRLRQYKHRRLTVQEQKAKRVRARRKHRNRTQKDSRKQNRN